MSRTALSTNLRNELEAIVPEFIVVAVEERTCDASEGGVGIDDSFVSFEIGYERQVRRSRYHDIHKEDPGRISALCSEVNAVTRV